jgi:hypothetical protein
MMSSLSPQVCKSRAIRFAETQLPSYLSGGNEWLIIKNYPVSHIFLHFSPIFTIRAIGDWAGYMRLTGRRLSGGNERLIIKNRRWITGICFL